MATGSKTRYSIELDLTTGKAEQSVKAATDKIKERLNSIATEANKTKYFEGLIGDIHDVDTQLTQLKEKHGKDFESIYQGIGEGARQEFELVFAYARSETEKFYAEIKAKQAEFSGLQQIQKDYKKYSKSATQAISGAYITGFGKSMDVTQVQNMYNSFDKLLAKKAEFEKVGNTSSKEYLENYVQILKTASGLIKADAEVANDDKDFGIDVEALYNMAEKAKSILNSLDINGFASRITDATNLVKVNLQEQMKSFAEGMPDRIKNAFSGAGGNNQADQNKAIALSYDELSKKLNEYLKLQKMADEGIDFDSDGKNIQDQISDLEGYFDALGKTDEEIRKIQDITGNVAFNDLGIEDAIQQMSEFINIVNASEKSINSLRNSIQEVFMSSSNIEADTRSGKLNGKESMNLFDINGNVSTVQGADYQVDTDTLVKQVVANLNKNIVMSLHNHANGDLTFSPSDISSFAKLYYGQGTKINGIIADGIIQTIDFNGVSQETAIKIAQDYQEGIKNLFSSENIARFASFEDGEIVPTDLLKQIQTNNAAEYQEIVSQLQEATMITLRQAFESNGAEFTLQSFNVDSIEELAQYLSNIQQNGQAVIEPVKKLKNLVETLQPGTDLEQFTEIFDKFKSGAIDGTQALNQILDFKTVAADVETVTTSINQAESKVKEFLALADEINNKSFNDSWDATDNVKIGEYTERLNVAKAVLDELGDQGQLTAEQLEQVNNAFNMATGVLEEKTKKYDSYYTSGQYSYTYLEEYETEKNRANQLEAENKSLREQLNSQQQNTEQNISSDITQELGQLENLHSKVIEVKNAIDAKTQAFEEEYVTVDAAVNAEVQSLQLLLQQLQDVLNTIGLINQAFTQANESIARLYGTKDIDIKEDVASNAAVEKSKEIINKQYALDSTVASTNKILGDILAAINKEKDPGVQENLGTLISALTANINALKDATSGVIDHQKAQKTDTTKAMARIQDSTQYKQISSIAENSIGDLGTDVHIKSLKALANGLVGVEGAFKDVNGEWEGFTVKVNESNNAVDLAINKQSAFAKVMRKLDEEMERMAKVSADANDRKLPPEATATYAIVTAQDYDDDGKEVTVQYKDSQRYTVSLKENIGGLQKEVFQTFDDSIKDFDERTTVTISNKTAAAIRDTNKLISENTKDVGNANLLREYNDEYGKLLQMNQRYRSMDDLGDDDIDTWNSQITLVQNLGNQITGLIKQQQRLENEKGVATSAKRLQEYQSNADKIFRELDFGLNEAKTPAQNQIVGIYDQIIEKVNALKKSHSVLTDQQTQEINTLIDSLKKEADAYKSTIDSVFKSDRDKKLSKFDLDQATLEKDINTSSFSDEINNARNAIANAANADSLKIAINGWEELQNKIKAAAIQQDLYYKKVKDTGAKPDKFTKDLVTQKTDFAQYKQEVEKATGVTDELKGKLIELENQLNSVGDADGLAKWVQSFKNVANEIKSSRGKIATEIIGKANSKFREVDFKDNSNNLTSEQQAIVDKRKELLKQIDEYNTKVRSGQNAEISGIEATRDALYQLIDAYKTKYNIENAGGSVTKKAYGTAQLQNFTGKYNSLMNRAANVELNSDFEAVQKLTTAYQHLKDVQAKFKVGEDTKSGIGAQKAEEFKQAQIECNRYAQELAKIITAEEQLRTNSNSSGGKSAPVAEDFEDSNKGRAQALEDFVRVAYGASASIGKLNDDMTELSFVVKNSDGTITNMTASLNAARTAIYATAGGTEKATTSFGRFFDELKNKARGITTYLISMTGFQEIWQQVKQGVQYVREIDSALTELKKVTDETDATYKKFLGTMSSVAGAVGSTTSELTQSAADWARLGYSIEQAGELAKNTAILMNVSEFDNVNDATEALISSLQAFGYEASNSIEIVDKLNIVGKYYCL